VWAVRTAAASRDFLAIARFSCTYNGRKQRFLAGARYQLIIHQLRQVSRSVQRIIVRPFRESFFTIEENQLQCPLHVQLTLAVNCFCAVLDMLSGGARILEQAGPAAGPKVLW